ncbi:aspartate--tRNA ligase [candidate division WOR-3 bacterium]|nr:aspartate--tRNA ligase [candidate division WOR-3 bacterium]
MYETKLRTHTCGELNGKNDGLNVILAGWVKKKRDHGEIVFIDLRDRYGVTQVIIEEGRGDLKEQVKNVRGEFVVRVFGIVRKRPSNMVNKDIKTGEIEVVANKIEILNESEVPPFEIKDELSVQEELRLKYRYLDLRRDTLKETIIARHKTIQSMRTFLSEKGFLEIETPVLTRNTPEGARDYLVPSRNHIGKFYSMAQSPQLYKQLLMVAGFDRYYQFARCFRDEDMRSDRQPEFTQIDIEMSFVDEEDVFKITEGLMKKVFHDVISYDLETPFLRLTYKEAMEKYGSDKPDLRFGCQINDITDMVKNCGFGVFENSDFTFAYNTKQLLSRKQIDEYNDIAKKYGLPGLFYLKYTDEELKGSIVKYLSEDAKNKLIEKLDIKNGDTLFLASGKWKRTLEALGACRRKTGNDFYIKDNEIKYNFLWVTEFPLFEWNEDEEKWEPCHHIFTMPRDEDIEYIESDPGRVHGKLYDLVCNGVEISSGSIRAFKKEIQERIMNVIGLSNEEAEKRFGFLIEGFKYGAPPHGGIAPGLDRLIMIMLNRDNIRDVIAFPKSLQASGIMEDSPSEVDEKRLTELGLKLIKKKGS